MSEETRTKGRRPAPFPLCLLVCEQVIVDETTKNQTAVGIFSDILATSFPAVHPRLAVYIELTTGHMACCLELRLVNAATDQAMMAIAGSVDFPDPRHVAQLRFNFNSLVFQQPGEYRFQLFADGDLLMERRVMVKRQAPA